MKGFLFFLISSFFLLKPFILSGQNFVPDSLKNIPIEEKVIYLHRLAEKTIDLDTILIISEQALKLSKTCNCDSLQMSSYYKKALFPVMRGKFTLAMEQLSGLEKKLSSHPDAFFNFRAETLKAYVYKLKHLPEVSLMHYEKALLFALQSNDSLFIADAYNNLGDAFTTVNAFKKAKPYFSRAIGIYERNNASTANRKQTTYQNLARTVTDLDSILYYSEKSYQNINDTTDAVTMAHFYINRADALINNGFYKESKTSCKKAYAYSSKIQHDLISHIALVFLGKIALEEGQANQALTYLNNAYQYKNINLQNKQMMLKALISVYKKTHQLKNALVIAEELTLLNDSIHKREKVNKYAEFDAKFNLAEKNKEIAQQELEIAKQKNTRNLWIFGSAFILLFGSSGVLWFNNKQKRKKALVQIQLQKQQEINNLRTKFLGNIAHEIRTPLTLISGNLQLALENFNNKTKAIQSIEKAIKNADTITNDANQILELLKFEKQKMTSQKTFFPLKATLKRIIFSFQSTAQIKNIQLSYNSSIPKKTTAITDVIKLEKIINNLLSNAIKYSPPHTTIEIKDAFVKNQLRVSVTDQGEGIHYDEQKKIFERFYQSKNAEKVGGIGIGLALSKEFSEFLGGTLRVDSQIEKGSTFTLCLPLEVAQSHTVMSENTLVKHDTHNTEKEPITHQSNTPHILIVEDNPQMAVYLQEILQPYYQCAIALNGVEALSMLQENQFDLITSDIMMPKIDGFEFRKHINQLPKYKLTPFIFISAKTLTEDKIKGFTLGVADYITKPFNKNELQARIKNLLKNKLARQQWQRENTNQFSNSESADQRLLKKVEHYITKNIENNDLKIKELATHVGYSQRQLTRLMKQYTGLTPVKFMLEIRLQTAYTLLQKKSYTTLSEVRYAVGINSSAYFNKKFEERFGVLPTDVLKNT